MRIKSPRTVLRWGEEVRCVSVKGKEYDVVCVYVPVQQTHPLDAS